MLSPQRIHDRLRILGLGVNVTGPTDFALRLLSPCCELHWIRDVARNCLLRHRVCARSSCYPISHAFKQPLHLGPPAGVTQHLQGTPVAEFD